MYAVFDVGGFPWSWPLRARAEADLTVPHVAAVPKVREWMKKKQRECIQFGDLVLAVLAVALVRGVPVEPAKAAGLPGSGIEAQGFLLAVEEGDDESPLG